MNALLDLFSRQRRSLLKALVVSIVLISLVLPFQTTYAASKCQSSGPVSAAYTLTACITSPSDGASVSGSRTVNTTVTVTGTHPGIAKLIFYLNGEYLITDYQSPYSFVLPSTKFVDGSRLLEAEVIMKDGFISPRVSITLNFSNGITQPPVNTKTFTPKRGTTPPAGQAFVLAATGDGADGSTFAGSVTDMIASWNPNLFLYLGDVYNQGTATEFRNWYGTTSTFYGRFRSITNPILGNHEYSSGGVAPGYFDYWDNVPRYYSYNAGGWHFIALDSNCSLVPTCGVGQAQYQWLQNDLSTNTNSCTIAYFHHPVFNVGPEGPATRMNDMWALMAQYGVDIVMTGHDHNYQRWHPLDGSGAVSPTGITQFVAGGGGHGTQQFITSDSRLAVGFDTTPTAYGALRLQLNRSGASYQYINIAGTTLDSGSIACSGAPVTDTTAPNTPTGLSAAAVSPQQVRLVWTASTDNVGVTGYSIYRNGALLGSLGPVTSYDDTTTQPGTTYSYRVQAQDAAGNTSGLSNTATVTTSLLLFEDGFESGNLSQWTGASGLTVQQQAHAGVYGARGTSTGIATYAYKQLSPTQNELYYRLWFNILSQGTNSVYLQRFRTGSNGAILGVLVTSTGKLAYRNDVTGITTTSTTTISRGAWHELQVRVRVNGTAGATEVWLDGTRINDLSKTENLGTNAVGRVQVGESSTGRTYDVVFDQVALSTQFIGDSNPPGTAVPTSTNTPPVVSTSTRTPTPILTPTRTSTPVVTPTSTNNPSSAGPGLYDDRYSGWQYIGNWGQISTAGPYQDTFTYSEVPGSSATFTFTGNMLTLYYTQYTNRGEMDIYIDNMTSPVARLNANGSLVWQKTWTSALLSTGTHTVKLVHVSGVYVDIDAIRINGPMPAGTYDDRSVACQYTGNWGQISTAGPYQDTFTYSEVPGSSATFTFTGNMLTLYYTQYTNRGEMDIYIDNMTSPVARLNANGSLVWQKTWTSALLSTGTHTVKLVHVSGVYVDIDAIRIQ